MVAAAMVLAGCNELPSGETGPPPDLNILNGRYRLYSDPDNAAARWVRAHLDESDARTVERAIAYSPSARWFTAHERDLTTQVDSHVDAAARDALMPLLVASFAATENCQAADSTPSVESLARGIGDEKAIVVLEPGLLGSECGAQNATTGYLSSAVQILSADSPNAFTLVDATANGAGPPEVARRLAAAGLDGADGFTLNVNGYTTAEKLVGTASAIREAVTELTGRSDYLVLADSARNGAPVDTTCNPSGARTGPTTDFSNDPDSLQQAWITLPGTSDGPCGMAPESRKGDFVPTLAVELAG